ncbi:YoaK family protein [Streptomyces sp. NPDC001835]|uniref:YoaK family protein n=1 Tax=Streptomyces sp. NPDC001835 TaxID=3154528 RepID=UPI00331D1950
MLLVAASGGVEATSFLGLGHVFARVMTSNLALLGMAAGRGEPLDITAALLALGGFGAGTALVAWYTRASVTSAMHWPRRVLVVLAAEAVLLGRRPGMGTHGWPARRGAPEHPAVRCRARHGRAVRGDGRRR